MNFKNRFGNSQPLVFFARQLYKLVVLENYLIWFDIIFPKEPHREISTYTVYSLKSQGHSRLPLVDENKGEFIDAGQVLSDTILKPF